ncbi:MAG: hypothetical protein H0W96_12110 [Solirubrobacterales bacterium]|nr:hypothetical protein [Solirubrobacterales bacterium]
MAEVATGERRGDRVALRCGYERLREAVLCGSPDGFRLGHGVLATRGTVAWIAAVTEVAPSPATGEAAEALPDPNSASLPAAGEIVAVLAQMALAHAA